MILGIHGAHDVGLYIVVFQVLGLCLVDAYQSFGETCYFFRIPKMEETCSSETWCTHKSTRRNNSEELNLKIRSSQTSSLFMEFHPYEICWQYYHVWMY
jgi:hypothetical protein